MKIKEIISGFSLVCGWLFILISCVVYAFFWRVDNEPGAKDIPALLWVAISFCSLGGLSFLGSHIYLIRQKAWTLILIAWGVCIALLVGAITLLPVLLIFMV
ncbi:MAG: hypothetical protein GY755_09305 [Chloroflexi bacterium]|nr:hypothetical protein [Chloroflexota bacterium]